MFEESGFKIIEIKSTGGILEVMADLSAKIIVNLPMGKLPAIFIQKFVKFIGNRKIGKKLRKRTEFTFPLGYGLVAKKP